MGRPALCAYQSSLHDTCEHFGAGGHCEPGGDDGRERDPAFLSAVTSISVRNPCLFGNLPIRWNPVESLWNAVRVLWDSENVS